MHTIRLRAPWQCELLEGGATRFCRNFNRPTNLERERVWLIASLPDSGGRVRLNGCALGVVYADSPGRFDIAELLADHNRVEIEIDSPRATDLPGDVWLEIEE